MSNMNAYFIKVCKSVRIQICCCLQTLIHAHHLIVNIILNWFVPISILKMISNTLNWGGEEGISSCFKTPHSLWRNIFSLKYFVIRLNIWYRNTLLYAELQSDFYLISYLQNDHKKYRWTLLDLHVLFQTL